MPKVASKKSALEASIPLACADEAAAVAFLEAQRCAQLPPLWGYRRGDDEGQGRQPQRALLVALQGL
jgi:hypothetical protein